MIDRQATIIRLRILADHINDMDSGSGDAALLRDAVAHLEVDASEPASYCRPEVLAFAILMERELRANDHKPGWKRDSPISLARRVEDECAELSESAKVYCYGENGHRMINRGTVAEEAADVANMAMMVADVCGCLSETCSSFSDKRLSDTAINALRPFAEYADRIDSAWPDACPVVVDPQSRDTSLTVGHLRRAKSMVAGHGGYG